MFGSEFGKKLKIFVEKKLVGLALEVEIVLIDYIEVLELRVVVPCELLEGIVWVRFAQISVEVLPIYTKNAAKE